MLTELSKSLMFHVSFNNGPNADFALGAKDVYTIEVINQAEVSSNFVELDRNEYLEKLQFDVKPGLTDSTISIAKDSGKFGAALEFKSPNESSFLIYPAKENVAYSPDGFHGTLSLWMRVDATEIGGQYADPVQIGAKDASDASIWIDFTKNDSPPDFRLGIFGNQSEWDVTNKRGKSEEFFFRLAKVAEPPFGKDHWTHVVVTWEGLNEKLPGRGRLYLDGDYEGATGAIPEQLTWDIEQTTIRLGSGPFVGLLDDIAIFNRALSPAEIRFLYELERGVIELHSLGA